MLRFLRALLAGAASTLVDLAVLTALVSVFRLEPRTANVPSLLAGAIVQFTANRRYVFRAHDGPMLRQLLVFALVEIVALALNGVTYDVAMRALRDHESCYAAVRLVTSHAVFVGFSYPLWRLVFHVRAVRPAM